MSTLVCGTATAATGVDTNADEAIQSLQQQLNEVKAELRDQKAATTRANQHADQADSLAKGLDIKYRGLNKPEYTANNGMTVSAHGFLSVTGFYQNKTFSIDNGVNAEVPVYGTKGLSGIDLKRSRLELQIDDVPLIDGWKAGMYMESDFAGGNSGDGEFSLSMETPRLRLFYMDLDHAATGTRVRIGQQWTPFTPSEVFPPSLVNRLPLGYFGGGFVGWRNPGVSIIQALNPGSKGPKWSFFGGVYSSSWNGPGDPLEYETAANAGFNYEVQGKLKVEYKNVVAFVAGTYNRNNFKNAVDDATSLATSRAPSFDSFGYEAGVDWKPYPFEVGLVAFNGRGLAPLFANFSNFADNAEAGGYAIFRYHMTKRWSVNAFHGLDRPNRSEMVNWMVDTNNNGMGGVGSGTWLRYSGQQSAVNLQWHVAPITLGVQWLYAEDKETQIGSDVRRKTYGSQFAVGAEYDF
ncbi:MAG TPA: hypothetical protein VFQ88_03395 [Nevskiaceae bacterium]|nr:hypothetical protein [Nevskiaceae bacterium]